MRQCRRKKETGRSSTGGTRIGEHPQSTGRHLCGRAGENFTGDAGTEQHSHYFMNSWQKSRKRQHRRNAKWRTFTELWTRYLRKQLRCSLSSGYPTAHGGHDRCSGGVCWQSSQDHPRSVSGGTREAMKDREKYLWLCAQVRSLPDPSTLQKCEQVRNVFCRHMRKRRRHRKGQWLKRLIQRVGDAAEMGDWGRFIRCSENWVNPRTT